MDVTPDLMIKAFDEVFEWNDTLEEVSEAIKDLKPRDKSIVQMRYLQDLTQREVSVALNISQSYITRIEKKILKKIKKKMERNEKNMVKGAVPANRDEAIKLLKETKLTYGEIEQMTGIPYGTIANYAQAHRPKKVRKELAAKAKEPKKGMIREHSGDTDKAVQLLAEGRYTYAEVSKQSGVPVGSLTKLRRLYESGQYKWVNEPKKRVEIEVPVETPVINHPAFMG